MGRPRGSGRFALARTRSAPGRPVQPSAPDLRFQGEGPFSPRESPRMRQRPVVSQVAGARREADRGPGRRAGVAGSPAAGRARRLAACLAGACLTVFAGSPVVQAAEFERSFTYSADRLTVTTLVGSVRVERAPGSQMLVTVNVRGKDADQKWIKFDSNEGKDARLVVQFPVKEYRKYVYPKMGSGSRTSFSTHDGNHDDNDWFEDLMDLATGDRLEVRGSSFAGAIELWTDVTIKVPDSRRAMARLGVGQIEAESVHADLELRVRSGPIDATDITGTLDIDTGSGAVDVRRAKGELAVDTGSGSVHVEDVSGGRAASVETGSGSVTATTIRAEELTLDTGSGGVDLSDID